MSSYNNRLSTPIAMCGTRRSQFLRGKQQRALKAVPKRHDGVPRKYLVDGRPGFVK